MDVVLLSRLQFAFTIMFHYIFPPLTIGLGVILAYLESGFLAIVAFGRKNVSRRMNLSLSISMKVTLLHANSESSSAAIVIQDL